MHAGRTASATYRESRDETIRQADIVDGLTEHEDARYDGCEVYDEFVWSHREPHDDCTMCGTVDFKADPASTSRCDADLKVSFEVPGGTVVYWSAD